MENAKIRQPIVTVAGHVDHGKTSILDCFRGSCVQEGEAGGITQKISFTKFPSSQIGKACPLIEKSGVKLEIPGFLFIDTPGHAAFTSLRKRGGNLADLAVLVVAIKEGIKPQTAEVLKILKEHKTPFVIALNKLDSISGWKYDKEKSLKENVESQALNVSQEFQEALMIFQGSLQEYGIKAELFYDVSDFTKQVAIVPCSTRTEQGIQELLFTLCGLSQKFLKDNLKIGKDAKGVVLEVKKDKTGDYAEAILYDGVLKTGDEIAVASFSGVIKSKVRAIEEIQDLSSKYKTVSEAKAATGIKVHLTNKEGVLSGMPFQKIEGNLKEIEKIFEEEVGEGVKMDKTGLVVKADSLGSLEALIVLLKQEGIQVVKAGIGNIGKTDLISAKASLETNPLDAVILGFGVEVDEDLDLQGIKIMKEQVVYKLIEDLKVWRQERNAEIERERILGLASICKLELLKQYVFRNSNPAIFGVRVLAGKVKTGLHLIDDSGEKVARVKGLQLNKESVNEGKGGDELAMSLPGVNFERVLGDKKFLYADISSRDFKKFKGSKDLLSQSEMKVLQEIAEIKRRKEDSWGL